MWALSQPLIHSFFDFTQGSLRMTRGVHSGDGVRQNVMQRTRFL